jgi:hypothetical protein
MRGVSKRTQHIGRTLEISRIVRLVKTVFFFAPGRIATLTIAPGRMGCLVFSALRVHRPNILGLSRSRVVLDVSAARGTQAVCQRLRDFKSVSQIGFTNRLHKSASIVAATAHRSQKLLPFLATDAGQGL